MLGHQSTGGVQNRTGLRVTVFSDDDSINEGKAELSRGRWIEAAEVLVWPYGRPTGEGGKQYFPSQPDNYGNSTKRL